MNKKKPRITRIHADLHRFLFLFLGVTPYNAGMAIVKKTKIRVYVDTSVFGGVFDEEFDRASSAFFDEIRSGRFFLLTSELVSEEISAAPSQVQMFFDDMLTGGEVVVVQPETLALQDAYLKERIVSGKSSDDAMHVALATVANARMIVSWNFKHIVNFQKIPLYNAVNKLKGYDSIEIYSPQEVIEYEDEDI